MGRKDSGGQRVPRTLLNSRYIKELKEIREISNISFFSIIPLNSIFFEFSNVRIHGQWLTKSRPVPEPNKVVSPGFNSQIARMVSPKNMTPLIRG